MNDDRSSILEAIGDALDRSRITRAPSERHGPAPATAAPSNDTRICADAHGAEPLQGDRAVPAFQQALDRAQGVCHRVSSDAAAAHVIQAVIADLAIRKVVRSDDALVIDILERVAGGFELLPPDAGREAILDSDLGVSRATFGVAEYGTIVLASGDTLGRDAAPTERQRLVALLPETHIAILAASDLVATWDAALISLCRGGDRPPPTASFATGPSRTADIELELVIGVHGPRNQLVVLLEHR